MSFFDQLTNHYKRVPENQVSARGVQWLIANIDQFKTKIIQFMEPGKEMSFTCSMFVPNAMAEFEDHKLGIVYGEGIGHAFVRVSALNSVRYSTGIKDFASLVKAFQEHGYTTKKIDYISVF